MSVAEILAELPKLDPNELQIVFERTLELHEKIVFEASPELNKAIDEALAEPVENCLSVEEVRDVMKSWNSK